MSSVTDDPIEKVAGEPVRLTRLPRIRVAQIVMDYRAHGWSPDEMARHDPHLTLAEARAAMTYYYDHQAENEVGIRDEVAENRDAESAALPSPFLLRMQGRGIL